MANGAGNWDEIKRAAYGALQVLKDNLPVNCELSIEREENVVMVALKRHSDHLLTHAVNQSHLDPFKLVCWLGCAIVDGLEDPTFYQHGVVVDSLITTLEEILVLETAFRIRVTDNDRKLLQRLVLEELKGNTDHGIGFNGLFVAFHCYRSSFNQMNVSGAN
jgi:hypothetical protein